MNMSPPRDVCLKCGARYASWLWIFPARGLYRQRITCRRCGTAALVSRSTALLSLAIVFVIAVVAGVAGYAMNLGRNSLHTLVITVIAVIASGFIARFWLAVDQLDPENRRGPV